MLFMKNEGGRKLRRKGIKKQKKRIGMGFFLFVFTMIWDVGLDNSGWPIINVLIPILIQGMGLLLVGMNE